MEQWYHPLFFRKQSLYDIYFVHFSIDIHQSIWWFDKDNHINIMDYWRWFFCKSNFFSYQRWEWFKVNNNLDDELMRFHKFSGFFYIKNHGSTIKMNFFLRNSYLICLEKLINASKKNMLNVRTFFQLIWIIIK